MVCNRPLKVLKIGLVFLLCDNLGARKHSLVTNRGLCWRSYSNFYFWQFVIWLQELEVRQDAGTPDTIWTDRREGWNMYVDGKSFEEASTPAMLTPIPNPALAALQATARSNFHSNLHGLILSCKFINFGVFSIPACSFNPAWLFDRLVYVKQHFLEFQIRDS